jgi:hypothetical protein
MPQITAAFPTITPATTVALPGRSPQHRRDRPLRSDNPQGNPDLAPRCGAKMRTTGCPCPAPAMPSGRCRMHGGKSTGPGMPQGVADLARGPGQGPHHARRPHRRGAGEARGHSDHPVPDAARGDAGPGVFAHRVKPAAGGRPHRDG